jgi:hypothetical protein
MNVRDAAEKDQGTRTKTVTHENGRLSVPLHLIILPFVFRVEKSSEIFLECRLLLGTQERITLELGSMGE